MAFQNNRDFLPKPPANQTQHEQGTSSDVDYFDILEASEEENVMFQDYIVDARSDLPFDKQRRFRAEFRAKYNRRNNNLSTQFQECDPISALSPDEYERKDSIEEDMTTMQPPPQPSMQMLKNTTSLSSLPALSPSLLSSLNGTKVKGENISVSSEPSPPPSLSGSDVANKTLMLDTPFSWILRDKEIGEVFYGSVSSLCQYNRAVQHSPTVPVWVLDLFKAFYWRCV